jgi:hypothetical protein
VRLSGRAVVILFALAAIGALAVALRVVPARDAAEAGSRAWIAARGAGVVGFLLLTGQTLLGLIMSHPTNLSRWKLSRHLFPWHEDLAVFTAAFLALHVVALVLDPFAQVGVLGALVPGLSGYRPVPIALGVLALDALIVTAVTARYTRLLPPGIWLRIHRLAAVAWFGVWIHGVTAGTDGARLLPMYLVSGGLVLGLAVNRHWTIRRRATAPARPFAPQPALEEVA